MGHGALATPQIPASTLQVVAVRLLYAGDADVHGHEATDADRQEHPKEQSVDSLGKSLPVFPLNIGQRCPPSVRTPRRRGAGAAPSRSRCGRFHSGHGMSRSPDGAPAIVVRRRGGGGGSSQKEAPDDVWNWFRRVFT